MNGLPRHPGTEEIAEYQAGAIDDDRGNQVAAHLAECSDCSSLSSGLERIPLILASIPPPALPSGVETRIMAALTAESARRIAPDGKIRHLAGHALARTSPGGRPAGPPAGLRRTLIKPLGVLVAAAACLILAFVGFRLSGQGHPGGTTAAGRGPARSSGHAITGGVAGPRQNSTIPALRQPAFLVRVSSANFRSSTLESQVQDQLSGSADGNRVSPSASLVGCVARLAGGARLVLVEEASYQSRPAYVIVIPAHAWVVARRCTQADPAVLASVALPPSR